MKFVTFFVIVLSLYVTVEKVHGGWVCEPGVPYIINGCNYCYCGLDYRTFVCTLKLCSERSSQEKVVAVTAPSQHAEGPYWDHKEQALYYVDTFVPAVLRWKSSDNKITSQELDGNSVGLIVPIKDRPKKFLVCRDRRIDLFSWDGASNNSGTLQELTSVDQNKPDNQFNDGKADAKGRLWAGTLTRNEDLSVSSNGGSLFKINGDKLSSPETMLSPVTISNGLAWSKDNKKFYYIDSATRKIVRYKFDLSKGTVDSPEVLFDLEDHPDLQGIPDGMTIDADDDLWVALYGGKSVIKINSASGKLLRVVEIPATYVTSVAFGGPRFDVLYVTTSKLKLTAEEEAHEPQAGSVFAVYNLGVQGRPADEFSL